MLFDTSSEEIMKECLIKIIKTDFYSLQKDVIYVRENETNNSDCLNIKLGNVVDKHIDLSKISDIYLYHLSRRVKEPENVVNLVDLVTKDSEFRRFLDNSEINFDYRSKKLFLYYYGNLIDEEQIKEKCKPLAKRLGYLGQADFCINGFLFPPSNNVDSDGYLAHLSSSPEILQDIDFQLGLQLSKKYLKKTKYYLCSCKISVKDLIIDRSYPKLDESQSNEEIYMHSFLISVLKRLFLDIKDNIVCRLPDKRSNVEVTHYFKCPSEYQFDFLQS